MLPLIWAAIEFLIEEPMKETNCARIPLLVTEHFKLELEKTAKAEGRTVNGLVRHLLESALKDERTAAA
jgi:hypothetical protein